MKFVKAILEGDPVDVYGNGRMSRDFTYIDDLIEAIIRLSKVNPTEETRVTKDGVQDTLSPEAPFRVVNIGGGRPVGLEDFISTIEELTARPAKRNLLPMQQGDMVHTFASPDLLEALTGFVPATPLKVGLDQLVKWYTLNSSLFSAEKGHPFGSSEDA